MSIENVRNPQLRSALLSCNFSNRELDILLQYSEGETYGAIARAHHTSALAVRSTYMKCLNQLKCAMGVAVQ